MDTIASRLEKVKSTMDNGTFLFIFNNSNPIAVHRDWLFKEYVVNKIKRPERIKQVFFEEKVGILYDSGAIAIPTGDPVEPNNVQTWKRIVPPKITVNESLSVDDEFTSFVYMKDGTIYATTKYRKLYKFTKETADELSKSNIVTIPDVSYTPDTLFGDSNSVFLKTMEGNIYFIGNNDSGQGGFKSDDGDNPGGVHVQFTLTSLDGNKIVKIFTRYKRTYILYETGYVQACGNNKFNALGISGDQSVNVTTPTNILDFENIIDISIGRFHTYFLNQDYKLLGVGSNKVGQLYPDRLIGNEYTDTKVFFKTDLYFRTICATALGFVGVTLNGKLVHHGGFIKGEMGYNTSNTDPSKFITVDVGGETFEGVYITEKPITLHRQYIETKPGDSSSLVSVIFNSVFNNAFGVLLSREDGKCLYTGENRENFLNPNMGATISSWTSIENDKNDIGRISKEVDTIWSVYHDIILNWDKYYGRKATYYKNDNGKWINYGKMMGEKANDSSLYNTKNEKGVITLNYSAIYSAANSPVNEEKYAVSSDNFPTVRFLDGKGVEYIINKCDGKRDFGDGEFKKNTFFDTLDESKFRIELFSRKYETSMGSQPYLQHRNDVKLTLTELDTEYTFDNFITWMNGMIPRFNRYPDNKSMYILNGTSFIPTIRKCEKTNTEVNLSTSTKSTVEEPKTPTELRWDFNIKLFGWKDVLASNPEEPLSINNTRFTFNDRFFDIPDTLIFENEVEEDSFILLMNGVVLNENNYSISENNKRKIILKNYKSFVLSLFIELVGKEYKTNKFDRLKDVVTSNKFTMIRFKSTDETRKIKVYRDRECIRNSPYPGQVTFRDVDYNDLILVDGHYIPYLWENHKSIRFPDTISTVRDSENDYLNDADIYRLLFYSVKK